MVLALSLCLLQSGCAVIETGLDFSLYPLYLVVTGDVKPVYSTQHDSSEGRLVNCELNWLVQV